MPAWRICSVRPLRNVALIVPAQATIGFGSALVDSGAVSFLGLGVQAPQAEWGLMFSEGRSEVLDGVIQQSLTAGVFIVITVVALNILRERLTSRSVGARWRRAVRDRLAARTARSPLPWGVTAPVMPSRCF